MSLTARHPVTNFYPVEVSGWDASESFFVEKSELEWEEDAGKRVILHRTLGEGAHVFVRLIQSPEGHWQFRLLPVRPRANRREPGEN